MKKLLALPLLTLLGVSLNATILIPGDVNVAVGSSTVAGLTLSGGPIATSSVAFNVSGGSGNLQHLSGTLISAVYRTVGGTLDFFYQVIQNPKPPANPFDNTTTQDLFGPITAEYSANAFFVSNSGSLTGSPFSTPSIVSGFQAGTQSLTASRNDFAVDFHLKQLPLTNDPARTTSAVFVIATDATLYKADTAQVAGGTVAANPATFAPTPEPGFYGALAVGLGVLFSAVSRRNKKETVNL